MRILIIGASKGTGALAVKAALERGHEVTAFARSPERLGLEHPKLTKVKGDFHNNEDVERAVPGHDAVIVTASAGTISSFKENPTYFSQGTALVIRAMKASGVRRLVVLSALGVGETSKIAVGSPRKFSLACSSSSRTRTTSDKSGTRARVDSSE
jgi:putative NADH-flavin reductase